MKSPGRVSALTVALLSSGCTSLSTTMDYSTSDSSMALTGIPYSLPMLQYETRIVRTLTQCTAPSADGTPSATPRVRFTINVEAAPKYVPGETYLIDYRALAGFTKITSFSVETHESTGTLKAINAAAEDRSSQIIQASVRTAIGVASLAMGVPVPGVSAQASDPAANERILVCAPGTQELLTAVSNAAADLRTATNALERITTEVNRLTELARINALDDAGKARLNQLIVDQRAGAVALTGAQTKLDRARERVSSIFEVRWPRAFRSSNHESFELREDPAGQQRLEGLLREGTRPVDESDPDSVCQGTIAKCLNDLLPVNLVLDPLVAPGRPIPVQAQQGQGRPRAGSNEPHLPQTVDARSMQRGVFIRPPVRGRLLACQRLCSDTPRRLLLRTDDAIVPQLGQLRFLPFRNQMFQNNALSLLLRADGTVEKFEYRETSARGETVANTAADAVGQLGGFANAIRARRDAIEAEAAAEVTADRAETLAAIQFQIDELTRQRQLAALQQTPDISNLTAVRAETEAVNARVALLQAQLAERNAQAALQDD